MIRLRVDDLIRRFPDGGGVGPCDLEVRPGERFVLVGPSGAGKSTLLRLIAGLEEPDQGAIWFDDRRVDGLTPARREVGFVAQRPALLPHLNVEDNLAFGARLRGSRSEQHEQIQNVAQKLQITPLLRRRPDGLSQGERQRVALGRLLMGQFRLWLLDEPFSALDFSLRQTFRDELHLLQLEAGATMLYVTHDPIEASALADRIAVLADGIIRQIGTTEELIRDPADLRVASCLGWPAVNLFPGSVLPSAPDTTEFRSDDNSVVLTLPAVVEAGSTSLCIRPEHVTLSPSPGALSLGHWESCWREFHDHAGPATTLVLRRGRSILRVIHADAPPPEPVGTWIRPNDAWLFDTHSGARIRPLDEHRSTPNTRKHP